MAGGIATLYIKRDLYPLLGAPVEFEGSEDGTLLASNSAYQMISGVKNRPGDVRIHAAYVMFPDQGKYEKHSVELARSQWPEGLPWPVGNQKLGEGAEPRGDVGSVAMIHADVANDRGFPITSG